MVKGLSSDGVRTLCSVPSSIPRSGWAKAVHFGDHTTSCPSSLANLPSNISEARWALVHSSRVNASTKSRAAPHFSRPKPPRPSFISRVEISLQRSPLVLRSTELYHTIPVGCSSYLSSWEGFAHPERNGCVNLRMDAVEHRSSGRKLAQAPYTPRACTTFEHLRLRYAYQRGSAEPFDLRSRVRGAIHDLFGPTRSRQLRDRGQGQGC